MTLYRLVQESSAVSFPEKGFMKKKKEKHGVLNFFFGLSSLPCIMNSELDFCLRLIDLFWENSILSHF